MRSRSRMNAVAQQVHELLERVAEPLQMFYDAYAGCLYQQARPARGQG